MFIDKKKDVFAWGVAFLAIALFCPHILLAEKSKITVNRSVIDLSAQSGLDVEFSFTIRNDSQEKQRINLEAEDIALGNNNVMEIIKAQGGPSELVKFAENDFVLDPNGEKEVSGVMMLSQEEKEASFYNMLTLVSFSSAEDGTGRQGPRIQGKIGIYTFIKVGENHNASGTMGGITLPKIIKGEQDLGVAYRNTGDVYFVPEKEIKIRNLLGGSQRDIFLDDHFVFPGKEVIFSGKIGHVSPWGIFHIKIKFIDGAGGLQIMNKYACGYLFPIGALSALVGILTITVFIMRKRSQIEV